MSTYSKNVWDQIRGTTNGQFEKALQKDGFEWEQKSGAIQIYQHPETQRKVSVHSHPGQIIRRGTLKGMLDAAGWITEDDLIRVGLIKRPKGKRRR